MDSPTTGHGIRWDFWNSETTRGSYFLIVFKTSFFYLFIQQIWLRIWKKSMTLIIQSTCSCRKIQWQEDDTNFRKNWEKVNSSFLMALKTNIIAPIHAKNGSELEKLSGFDIIYRLLTTNPTTRTSICTILMSSSLMSKLQQCKKLVIKANCYCLLIHIFYSKITYLAQFPDGRFGL